MQGDSWQLGAVAIVLGNILGGCSLVAYYAILVDISTEDERDHVSSRGWAWGYLGGGCCSRSTWRCASVTTPSGSARGWRCGSRCCPPRVVGRLHAHPAVRLRNHPPLIVGAEGHPAPAQLRPAFATLREPRRYPMTLTFLLAYLFYNDGIQTVISRLDLRHQAAEVRPSVLIATILLVQFVAFGGALLFGRLARSRGLPLDPVGPALDGDRRRRALPAREARRSVPAPRGRDRYRPRRHPGAVPVLLQPADPRGREGEYFSLYNAPERGTSWFGTLVFGLVSSSPAPTGPRSWRSSCSSCSARSSAPGRPQRGIREAGNAVPVVV